jgi:2,4-dienoyl-CoA reductase-like NADH-dependent reductase (Old Yellow Enzyme family)
MPHLFEPIAFRGTTLRNRIAVSPMCEYSSKDGFANDWHLVHLGSRAVGGAGLVFTEAAAVVPEGRISPEDLGAWSEAHFEPLARVAHFMTRHGAVAGIQLAHAGRKASTYRPFPGHPNGEVKPEQGGWQVVAPSPVSFSSAYPQPREMTAGDIAKVKDAFVTAAVRAYDAGFRVVELHAAHGYLFHEFLSPLSNHRGDSYGGSFDNRTRIVRETAVAVRAKLPDNCVLFVRLSATDWTDGGWDADQTVALARDLKALGVDLIDVSSGGNVEKASIPVGPGYQTPFAEKVRREAGIAASAVGLITDPAQADHIVRTGQADLVMLARELLRDPYWPLHAAEALGHTASWPAQYLRAAPKGSTARAPLECADLN